MTSRRQLSVPRVLLRTQIPRGQFGTTQHFLTVCRLNCRGCVIGRSWGLARLRVIVDAPSPVYRLGLDGLFGAAGFDVLSPERVAAGEQPDVIVTWADGDDRSLASIHRLTSLSSPPVLVVNAGQLPAAVLLATGARGVVAFDDPPDLVVAAATCVAAGLEVGRSGVRSVPRSTTCALLSADERSWLSALGSGQSVVALALEAGYSRSSMYEKLAALYAKLGVSNRSQAVAEAAALGIKG